MKSITDFVKAHRNHKKSEDDKKKEKMRQIEERYTQESTKDEEKYAKNLAVLAVQGLRTDYGLLNSILPLSQYSPEETEKADKIYHILSEVPEKIFELTKKMLLDNASENVKEIILSEQNKENIPESVTSYIALDENSCYILSPIRTDQDEKGLTKDLSNKLKGILGLKEICYETNPTLNRERHVLNSGTKKISFEMSLDETEFGFRVYKITPKHAQENRKLMELLKERFESEKLAPESLQELGINHHLVHLKNKEFNYILKRGKDVSLDVPFETLYGAEKRVRGTRIKYVAPSKDKILNDIESLGDEITNADIMEIMAYSSLEGACGFAKKYLTPKESAETGKHYSREEFYEIMKTLESDKKGWRKKKWVNEIT